MAKAERYRLVYQPASKGAPKRGQRRGHRKFKIIFSWILFLLLAYILLASPLFRIKEINVQNNQIITDEEIKSSLQTVLSDRFLIFFSKANFWLVKKEVLANQLKKDYPRLSEVKIRKNIFNRTLTVQVQERQEIGILCQKTKSHCYYLDEQGIAFEEAPQTSGTLILVITDVSARTIVIGQSFASSDLIDKLIWAKKYLFNNLNISLADYEVGFGLPNDLKINTYEGWYILLDKSKDIKNQLQILKLILDEKIGSNRSHLEYIDLRIENRVYYK